MCAQYIALNRANIEIKYDYPCCAPAAVRVTSLPKGVLTTHVPTGAVGTKDESTLLYEGEVTCCQNVHFFPQPIAMPVDCRHDPVASNAESFRFRYGLPWEDMMSIEEGKCIEAELIKARERDELSPPQQQTVAAEAMHPQLTIGKVRDGGCAPNLFGPHVQCCRQKVVLSTSVCDNRGLAMDLPYLDVVTQEPTPCCCTHPCWWESSVCCKHKTCCTFDVMGCCGQSRSIRFRCCCCGEISHTYGLNKVAGTLTGLPEPTDGQIVVMGNQDCLTGRIADTSLTVLVQPPKGVLADATVMVPFEQWCVGVWFRLHYPRS